jgi:hypothetical protein
MKPTVIVQDEGMRMNEATGIREYEQGQLMSAIFNTSAGRRVGFMMNYATGECWVQDDPGELVTVAPVGIMDALSKLTDLGVIHDENTPSPTAFTGQMAPESARRTQIPAHAEE